MNDVLDHATGQISDNSPVVTTGSTSMVFIRIVSKRLIDNWILGFKALTTLNVKRVVCWDVGGATRYCVPVNWAVQRRFSAE
jgi:hypothetical protein